MDVKDIKKVVVAGGGVLGSQIAFQSAYMGYDVTIWLRSEGSIGRCQPKIDRLHKIYLDTLEAMKTDPRAYAYGLVAKEECTPEKCEALKANVEAAYKNLKLVTDWDEAFGDADYVIEAVAEDPKQKEDFYTELQKHLPEKTFIVTNSSTLLPSTFAEYTGRPEKFLALHFANDIWKMPSATPARATRPSSSPWPSPRPSAWCRSRSRRRSRVICSIRCSCPSCPRPRPCGPAVWAPWRTSTAPGPCPPAPRPAPSASWTSWA